MFLVYTYWMRRDRAAPVFTTVGTRHALVRDAIVHKLLDCHFGEFDQQIRQNASCDLLDSCDLRGGQRPRGEQQRSMW